MALLEVGAAAPDFKGQNLTGPEFSLDALKGKKNVLLLFAPDQINPTQSNQVKAIYEKNRADVEIVSLIRKIPSISMAKAFLSQLGIRFTVVYDPKQEVYGLYGVENPMVIYAINKEGSITHVLEQDPKTVTPKQLQDAIASTQQGAPANG